MGSSRPRRLFDLELLILGPFSVEAFIEKATPAGADTIRMVSGRTDRSGLGGSAIETAQQVSQSLDLVIESGY